MVIKAGLTGLGAHGSPYGKPRFGLKTAAALGFLERNPLAELVVKDVLGFNIPKIAFTRTWKERFDAATLELSNTSITLLSSLVLPRLLRTPARILSGSPVAGLVGKPLEAMSARTKLARLAVSFGFMFPFATAFWAAAFFRNWLTIKRTKTANFENLIGLDSGNALKGKRSAEEEMRYQMGMVKKIMALGVGLGALAMTGFGLAARGAKGKALGAGMNWLFTKFALQGKNADQVNKGLATLVFWLLPAYGGWIHASRSKNELWEQSIKAANGMMWFSFFTPYVVDPLFKKPFEKLTGIKGDIPSYEAIAKKFKGPVQEQLTRLKNRQFGLGLAITILLLGTTPQLLNIFLTKRRFDREQARMGRGAAEPGPKPETMPDLRFKPQENMEVHAGHPRNYDPYCGMAPYLGMNYPAGGFARTASDYSQQSAYGANYYTNPFASAYGYGGYSAWGA